MSYIHQSRKFKTHWRDIEESVGFEEFSNYKNLRNCICVLHEVISFEIHSMPIKRVVKVVDISQHRKGGDYLFCGVITDTNTNPGVFTFHSQFHWDKIVKLYRKSAQGNVPSNTVTIPISSWQDDARIFEFVTKSSHSM